MKVYNFAGLNTENTYWEHSGKYQQFVDYIENQIDWLTEDLGLGVSKTLAANYDRAARMYKRFYNDGDMPRGFVFKPLNDAADYLEHRVNTQLEKLAKALNYNLKKGVK